MAAASRKEEERNERIVRGLLKLPPNRRCINCNALGPQYVCTSFWTFICISCSGIHREFTHRVKSVSMSKFTVREVEALQKGGNQRARESLLKDFDTQQMRLPDSSNIGSLREFIRVVYVEKRYDGVSFSERPPRDKQRGESLFLHAGWATFGTPPNDKQHGVTGPSLIASIGNKQTRDHDLFLFEPSDRPTSFLPSKDKVSVSNQSGATSHDTSCSQPWSIYDGTTGGTQSLTGDVSLMTSNLQEHKEANNYQIWHSFDDATGVMTNDDFTAEPLSNDHKNVINVSPTRSNPFTCTVASKQSHDDSHNVFMDELAPSAPFAAFLEPSPTSSLPSLERISADQVVLNPFDLPFDTVSETLDLIMDMSTLQAGLPNLPSSFIDGLPESWFSNNTSTYVPSRSHGELYWPASFFFYQKPAGALPIHYRRRET